VPRRKSGKRKTPEPLIPLVSDGIHFVRDASPKDQHPMKFVVDQHRGVEGLPHYSSLPRHCESLERGTALMKFYTDKACRESPALRLAHKIATGKIKGTRKKREIKPKKAVFPITRFTCIMANPVAQVWLCNEGALGDRQRRSAEGRYQEPQRRHPAAHPRRVGRRQGRRTGPRR
jgi:hypothetical protein